MFLSQVIIFFIIILVTVVVVDNNPVLDMFSLLLWSTDQCWIHWINHIYMISLLKQYRY